MNNDYDCTWHKARPSKNQRFFWPIIRGGLYWTRSSELYGVDVIMITIVLGTRPDLCKIRDFSGHRLEVD